jgi:hypothetical protein
MSSTRITCEQQQQQQQQQQQKEMSNVQSGIHQLLKSCS